MVPNAIPENFAGDARDCRLAGRVNLEQLQGVGILEGGREVVHQIAGAGVAVWLKDHMHPFETTLAGGFEGGPNLGGMMPVIVDHANAGSFSPQLKATIDATKILQTCANVVGRNIKSDAH